MHFIENQKFTRLVFLDYLRIIAFSSVLVGHKFYDQLLSLSNSSTGIASIAARSLLPIFWGGAAGVAIFFLVSGYIIGHVLKKEATGEFLVKRIFRIYPLYVAAVLIQLAAAHIQNGQPFPPLGTLLAQLSLLGDWFGSPLTLGGVEWTLRLELLFYAIMAVLKEANLLDNQRKFLPSVLILIIAATYLLPPLREGTFPYPDYISIFLPLLFVGLLLLLVEEKEISPALFMVFSVAAFGRLAYKTHQMHPNGFAFFGLYAYAIFLAFWLARKRLDEHRAVISFSALTYSVYLFHNWGWDVIKPLLERTAFGSRWLLDLQILAVLLIVCYAMHRSVERGGILLGRKMFALWNRRLKIAM